jgi:hypothetical protein
MDAPSDDELLERQRATSRRTGSKQDTTTVSGVSSMMTSTPGRELERANVAALAPDDAPFISSFGRLTAETAISAVCSAAIR